MLSISLISLFIAVPLFSYRITPNLFNRITCVTLIYASYLSFQATDILSEISIYNGLFHVTNISLGVESFIFLIGAIILLGWTNTSIIPEYSIIILFTTIGASLLVSSSDLVSMFLSIELQSFAVYVLATLYRGSESAGLKYFLLGGLSSALILLGTALIYTSTGVTHLEGIYNLISVPTEDYTIGVTFGMLLIGVGFLFKVASAPFHNWAPDVYDGTPTIVTSWLSTIPKISIFVFLLESNIIPWKNLLLIASLLSLIIGTVLGLSQIKIKRLLTYSTISHVGFLLLALAINSEESIESFLFYLFQYSITNITIFLVLLGFSSKDVETIQELKGKFYVNPLLCLSFALCLFSIAGIPPLLGFFAKQIVLYSSIHEGHYFLSIVAILVSVISASYYLKIVQVMYFNSTDETDKNNYVVTNMHSIAISTFTMVITLFVFQPIILLNGCHLLALSLFYY